MWMYVNIGGQGPGLVPREQAVIPVADRGFLYGDGLFETVLVRGGQLPLLPLHLQRLESSARELSIPVRPDEVERAARELAATLDPAVEHAMRITLSRGSAGPRGYQPPPEPRPTLVIAATPYIRPSGPLSAVTASMRINPDSPNARHKSQSCLEKVMARGEAARAGCDEALLLNLAGRVTEATASNLFIVRQGLWMTPPLADGCLPGVMRRRVMSLTGAVEWKLTTLDLRRCDAVYLTNALMGCLPLAALDGQGLPWGPEPGFAGKLFAERV